MIGSLGNPYADLVVRVATSAYAQFLAGPVAKVRPVKLR